MLTTPPATGPLTPQQLLELQVQRLTEISHTQQEQLSLLRAQSEKLETGLRKLHNAQISLGHVKIEDINMPYGALVGFLLKLTLASIPVTIIIGVLGFVLTLMFGGILSVFLRGLLLRGY